MRRINAIMPVVFLGISLAFFSCQKRLDQVELTDWQFEYNNQWYPAKVPGFIHTDLMANGIIADPYYGSIEDSVQWVGDSTWIYRTYLHYDKLPEGDTLWLVFEGLAGNVTLWIGNPYPDDTINGVVIVPQNIWLMDNMFCRYEVPMPGVKQMKELYLYKDSMPIMLMFDPLDDSVREAEYGIHLPDRRAFTRIAPYQQGWDWGPKLPTCGIWKPVYITNKRPTIETIDTVSTISKVELHQEQDSIGQSFTFYRDGKPVFVKGANWIPVHSFPVDDSANRARYRVLLCSAKEAGFNMLRVWGGGIYEHDYFYDLCDSLGLMVWQDFNFSTMLYPDNPDMLESIKAEAEQNIRRIAKHPCVVLWCGNNEVKNGWEDWGWQGVYNWTPEQRARLERAIDTIFGYSPTNNLSNTSILAQAVKDCDPLQRPYITTSPLYGWGHPECVTHGDSHYWGVWWGEEPFEKYAEKTGRFMSEYGFQSYPMISTIRRFCPKDQLSIDSPILRSHQKHGRGREIIDKAMRQYYGFDSKSLSLEDYCYISQLLQAWGTGYGIFQHIKQQPHCMGTLYWQLNDCWPVASWSSIDYYGNWKALHYRAQALYADNADLGFWEHYYSTYPKDRQYPDPKYRISQSWQSDGSLVVTIKAESDLYDVYIDTDPHIDGHFTTNFFDLSSGQKLTTKLIPADPSADVGRAEVKVRTLNELYFYRK
ncbi:MAG: hypothetical protein IKR83_02420 [Bacteroidales bacterium]|nr:hypothetical protein [Bacteroidales bacterium]